MLDRTLELYGLPDNWEAVAPFYLEAFEGVPADLVASALKHVRQHLKFFPKPAELRSPIEAEWNARKRALTKLRLAKGSIRAPEQVRPPPTEEQVAKVKAIVDRLTARSRAPGAAE